MKNKMLFVMATIAAFALFVPSVMAETKEGITDLATAVSGATDGDTLKLTANLDVSAVVTIDKELTIDLNGYDISLLNKSYLLVKGGNLTVTGKGTIKEVTPYWSAIMVNGSTDASASNYSVVTVGKDVTLYGWSGVFIQQSSTNTAYGVNVTVNGTINAVTDVAEDSTGEGVYINGKIQHTTNAPVITLGETAVITSDGVGIYAAGYAVWNINGATITGVESALAIKSGEFNITDGTFTATGPDVRPTEGYGNGINPSGSVIQVESNTGYAGNVELNITGGNFVSENGVVVYEYLASNATETAVESIEIAGGDFVSGVDEDGEYLAVFDVSTSFETNNTEFVTGGTFTTDEGEKYVSADEEFVVTADGNYTLASNTVVFTMTGVLNGEVIVDEDDEEFVETSVILKGYTFTAEEIEELEVLVEELNAKLAEEGLKLKGFYYDVNGTKEVDFTKALDEDTAWYMIFEEVTDVEELPPKTSDINLALLIGTIMLGVVGTVLVSKKRFIKNN